ncbi:MAG: hypothetical protein CL733_04265 [Chloroflexi bacterium]|nr:hypothetical protein [Chloroflexota bacterium]
MPQTFIIKNGILILIIMSIITLVILLPNTSYADDRSSRATPIPTPTPTPTPNITPIEIFIEENISVTDINQQSGIFIEENISITEEMNPPDEMLQELTNIAEEMQSREASREQSSREPTEERDRRDPFKRGTGDVQSDVSDSGSCNSSNSNEGLLLFAGLLIPAFLRIRKKVSKKSETQD